METTTFLSRLQGVRQTRPDQWAALCPAHKDRSPSLSIRATDDGKILFHCFSGCHPGDILESVGLSWRDLYPKPEQAAHEATLAAGHRRRQKLDAATTREDWAKWVLRIAAADLRQGRIHGLEDRATLGLAAAIAKGGQGHE
jgi:hypothetical protein